MLANKVGHAAESAIALVDCKAPASSLPDCTIYSDPQIFFARVSLKILTRYSATSTGRLRPRLVSNGLEERPIPLLASKQPTGSNLFGPSVRLDSRLYKRLTPKPSKANTQSRELSLALMGCPTEYDLPSGPSRRAVCCKAKG